MIVSARVTPRQATQLFVDAVESTGLAVTEKADGFEVKPGPRWSHCATASGPPAPSPAGPRVAPSPVPAPAPTPPPSSDPDANLDDALALGIHQLDDTHYEIASATLDQILQNPMALAKGARIVPALRNGRPEGFKIYGIRPTSLFALIGLHNGDLINTINGHRLDSADKALEIYTSLRDARQIEIRLERGGAPLKITITVKS